MHTRIAQTTITKPEKKNLFRGIFNSSKNVLVYLLGHKYRRQALLRNHL
jgi:hypothetical protein